MTTTHVEPSQNNDVTLEAVVQVAEFVVECRGRGFCLPHSDLEIIRSWVQSSRSFDELVLILSETLPEFFEKRADKTVPPSLRGVNRRVLAKLKQFASRELLIR